MIEDIHLGPNLAFVSSCQAANQQPLNSRTPRGEPLNQGLGSNKLQATLDLNSQ